MTSKLTGDQASEVSATVSKESYPGPGGDVPGSDTTTPDSKSTNVTPRSTRSSQNPDFVLKQRRFLNRVVHDPTGRDSSDNDSQGSTTPTFGKNAKENKAKPERKSTGEGKKKFDKDSPKRIAETELGGQNKKKKLKEPTKVVGGVDSYCWRCHKDGIVTRCEICPRVYHLKCIQSDTAPINWVCLECTTVTQAENTDTRSRAMRMITLDQLCNLLRYALDRMESHEGSGDFANPVDLEEFPQYRDFIVKPMDLTQLRNNIKAKMYGSTDSFLADAKWIVHNSIIFNSVHSKFTNSARGMLKICRQEMSEIENCPDCYMNAHVRSSDSWFIEACRRPHVLVWAKLKGFPFWPAKAMCTNDDGQVDVRFFGAHDRAWVPLSSCYLYSKLSPAPNSNKGKRNMDESIKELECHIKKLRDKFGRFEYPPYKTFYDPLREEEQLLMFLPMYEAKTPGKRPRISLHQDGARKKIAIKQKASPLVSEKTTTTPENHIKNQRDPPILQTPMESKIVEENEEDKAPMVEFPDETPDNEVEKISESEDPVDTTISVPETSHTSPSGMNKVYKTPLTAGAKKCFASKDQACIKCHTHTSQTWHSTKSGTLLCASCKANTDELINDKQCSVCGTGITMSWFSTPAGLLICSSCHYAEQNIEFDEGSEDSGSTLRGTVTVQRRSSSPQPTEELSDVQNTEPTLQTSQEDETSPSDNPLDVEKSKKKPLTVEEGDSSVGASECNELVTSTLEELSTQVETDISASPPKFVISKSAAAKPGVGKKLSIVDKLHDKFQCVEEALKDTITPEDNATLEDEVENVTDVSLTINDEVSPVVELPKAQVLLHDLKDNSVIIENFKNNNEKVPSTSSNINNSGKSSLIIPPDSGSDVGSDVTSSPESDTGKGDKNTKRKYSNINDVVRNLTERRSSIDEKAESRSDKNEKDVSNAISLDDFSSDGDVLVIDEGDLSDSRSPPPGKQDRSRRKGTPARVLNKSSSSETNSISLTKASLEKKVEETAEQAQLTNTDAITLVLGDDKPQQKSTPKKLKSVNISKSLSLSIINNSIVEEIYSNDSDSESEDPIIVEQVVQKPFIKPRAKKTFPNLPKSLEVSQGRNSTSLQNKQSIQGTAKSHQRQPTTELVRPSTKAHSFNKAASSSNVSSARQSPETNKSTSVTQKSANAQLEEAVSKVQSQLRGVIEEMLCNMSENGSLEATVKALQIDIERQQWKHRVDLAESKHNTDLVVMEIRASMETEKQRAVLDTKHKCEMEKEQAIQETKKKQWCTYCLREAQLYCCWNTAYCSYECQQGHWNTHMNHCSNRPPSNNMEEAVPAPQPTYSMSPSGQRLRQLMPPPSSSPPLNQLYSVTSRLQPSTQYSGSPMSRNK